MHVIMLGGRFPERENNRICQTLSLKTGRGRLISQQFPCSLKVI